MKSHFLFLTAALLLIVGNLNAQVFQGELIGGMNLSQVDGDMVFGFNKVGFNAGVGVIMPINEKFSISMEVLYSQKGAFQTAQMAPDSVIIWTDSTKALMNKAYNLRLDYVEVPLLLMYNEKDIFTVGVGGIWGRRVGVKEIEWDIYDVSQIADEDYSLNDFSILGDFRFRCYQNFWVNLRYTYSLTKIRTKEFFDRTNFDTFSRKQYNNSFALRLIWVINGGSRTLKQQRKEHEYY